MTLEAGKTYRIDLEGSATRVGTLYDPYLYGIYDAAGNPIDGTTDNDDGKGLNSRVFFTAPQAATYYVSAGGNGQSQGTYRLSVREVPDDFTAGTDTTGTVEIGGSTRGEIEVPYDRDWFAVTLEAGRRYQFDVEGSQTGAGTLVYPYLLGVYDANGNFAFDNSGIYHYPGNYQQIYFTAPKAATYYVAATPWRVDIGTYTLSARDVTDDYAAGMDTTGRVAVDGSVTGEIEVPYDDDWFAVTLKAGRTYRIDLKGASTGDGTLDDPRLIGVRDAGGALISLDGSHSRLLITPLGDATYYVVAAGRLLLHGGWRHREAQSQFRHLHTVGYGCHEERRGRFRGWNRNERHGGGRRLGDGRDWELGRPRLVCGGPRGGQDLPHRPGGYGDGRRQLE